MKVGDRAIMSHPGKRDGEIGVIKEIDVPIKSHPHDNCRCGIRLEIGNELWLIHRNWVKPLDKGWKGCEFIEVENTDSLGNKIRSIFVPRPSSFFGGWARHQWLKSYFKQECSIASPEFWKVLIERHGKPKMLIEENGEFREEESEE